MAGLGWKKAVKIKCKEECNNILALVGLPKIDQEEVEAILKLVVLAKNALRSYIY